MKKKIIFIAIILLLCQFLVQIYLAKTDSQTTDEAVHLSAGYTYLVKHDFRFNPEHPPLVKMLAALPLLFVHPQLPTGSYWEKGSNFFYDTWRENVTFGELFLYKYNNADLLLFLGHMPMILLTLILGISVFIIATRLWGYAGGLISLAFYVLDPNIMAHGHLITTDIAISLGYLWTLYLFWLFLNNISWKKLLPFIIVFGLTQLVKFTAVILLPVLLILLIYFAVQNKWEVKKYVQLIPMIIIFFIANWFLIWACYGFKATPAPATNTIMADLKEINYTNTEQFGNYASSSSDKVPRSKLADKVYTKARYVLIPRDYFKGLIMVLTHVEGGHSSFLLGNLSNTGWWYYFPVLFIFKTPIPTLIALGISLYLLIKNRQKYKPQIFLALGAGLFIIFAMFSKANLGLRHIFPAYPLIFLTIGGLVLLKFKKLITLVLLGWLLIEFVLISPYFLSYFNEFAGGSKNGYNIASDSNLDWGQDLKRIKKYVDEKNIPAAYIEYNWGGKSSLDYYKIKHLPIEQFDRNNPSGYLIIGASALDQTNYSWLKNIKYYDRITPSVFIYKFN